jgi:hypothetical protein
LGGRPRDQRARLASPIRYRRKTEGQWHSGETVDISGSGLLFLSEAPLELGTEVEVILRVKPEAAGNDQLLELVCQGRVVRRVLANWPEVRPATAIKVFHCQMVPKLGEWRDRRRAGGRG